MPGYMRGSLIGLRLPAHLAGYRRAKPACPHGRPAAGLGCAPSACSRRRLRGAARQVALADDARRLQQGPARGALAGDAGQVLELLLGKAGLAAIGPGDRDGGALALGAGAAEAELLVHLAPKVLGPLEAIGVVPGELLHPLAAEAHVGEL